MLIILGILVAFIEGTTWEYFFCKLLINLIFNLLISIIYVYMDGPIDFSKDPKNHHSDDTWLQTML